MGLNPGKVDISSGLTLLIILSITGRWVLSMLGYCCGQCSFIYIKMDLT